MAHISGLTVINGRNLRGVLGPPALISKALLEDLVDAIELSSPEVVRSLEARVAEADRSGSWVAGSEVDKRVKARRKTSKASKTSR